MACSPLICVSKAQAQLTAASALQWSRKRGATVEGDDMVLRIANLGARGQHPSNIERDFHVMRRTFCRRLGAKLSSVSARTEVERFTPFFVLVPCPEDVQP